MRKLLFALAAMLSWTGVGAHDHDIVEIAAKVLPSVTYIEVERYIEQHAISLDNDDVDQQVIKRHVNISPIIGSGFVIEGNFVITNYHVISYVLNHPESKIWVYFYNENDDVSIKYLATVVGYDEITDVALLSIPGEHQGVELCASGSIKIGSNVFSISNFYGIKFSVTTGIVSSTNRADTRFPYVSQLQLQIAAGSGSSGGPVFNELGQVASMNHTVLSMDGNSSINNSMLSTVAFSIRSDVILSTIMRIEKQGGGAVEHPDLGVLLVSFGQSSRLYQDTNDGENIFDGLMVKSEDYGPNSTPFEVGDIIVELDGLSFSSPRLFFIYLDTQYKVGDSIKLLVYRNGRIINMTMKLQAARRI
jgi:S1-C subfamily serine protease